MDSKSRGDEEDRQRDRVSKGVKIEKDVQEDRFSKVREDEEDREKNKDCKSRENEEDRRKDKKSRSREDEENRQRDRVSKRIKVEEDVHEDRASKNRDDEEDRQKNKDIESSDDEEDKQKNKDTKSRDHDDEEDRQKNKESKSRDHEEDRRKDKVGKSREDEEDRRKDKDSKNREDEDDRRRDRDRKSRGDDEDRRKDRDRKKRDRYRGRDKDEDMDRYGDDRSHSNRGRDRDEDLDRYGDDRNQSHSNRRRSRDRYKDVSSNRDRRRESRSRSRGDSRERYRYERSRYRDREDSQERYGKVSQNSYYGTEVSKNHLGSERSARDSSRERSKTEGKNTEENANPETIPPRQRKTVDLLTSKTGGAYIPPAKLRMMQAQITDKSGAAYQRIAWEALKKSIHGYINKVNTSNIGPITRDLLKENVVRGRGLLARSIIQAQALSLTFTNVYAALVAVINSKFPNIGELIVKRLAIQFKRSFKRNDKTQCISSSMFIAHLVNQGVAHEILILEILTLLVQNPTDDSIEVAIAVLKECGMKLTQICKKGIEAIFEMLRNILHEGKLDKRVQYMIEVVFQIRKDGFKDFESVINELDLVEEEDQYTHLVQLDDALDGKDVLNVFKYDDEYVKNEDKYKELSKDILNSDDSDEDDEEGSGDGSEEENSDEDGEGDGEKVEDGGVIIDNTETNLTALRRTIYLTIHSSLDFEECAHKLLKMQLKPGQEIEFCHMFLDCCAERRTYEKFYGLLAQRFCAINRIFVGPFEDIFKTSYDTIHRLDTDRLRNVSKFFAHLLMNDSISWAVLCHIKLNEEDTTSSSRVFIKILFQELSEYMGLPKLNAKLKDEELQPAFSGLFPKDDPKNTRFAINFFTSIGLGGLTDDLREHLKNRPKAVVPETIVDTIKKESSSSDSSSSSSSSDSSDSSSSSSSESESSEDEKRKKKKKKESAKKKLKTRGDKDKKKKEKTRKEKANKENALKSKKRDKQKRKK